jgi:acetolactate decarboxylase
MSDVFQLELPQVVRKALNELCDRSGDAPEHIILRALAEFLDLEHRVVYQVSTSSALVEGVLDGAMPLREVLKHGDFGLGTFHGLDGEGILIDGTCWQALGDGTVRAVDKDQQTPFWVSTRFKAERDARFKDVRDLEDLYRRIDDLRISDNIFTGIRIDGMFDQLSYRVACKSDPGTDLLTATHNQAEFHYEQIEGSLVGFYTPEYAHTIGVPGYHFHFISNDRSQGGHVLGLKANSLEVALDFGNELKLLLPESNRFLKADLSEDPRAALEKAEKAQAEVVGGFKI